MAKHRLRLLSALAVLLPSGILIGTGGALAVSGTAGALGTTLYVAPSGVDAGGCTSSATPCKTLGYALSQASSTDTVELAAGTYPAATDPAGTSNTVTPTLLHVTLEGATGNPDTVVVTGTGEKNALVVHANGTTVRDLTFENAGQSGVLASPTPTATTPASVATLTITTDRIVTNDKCATTPTVAASTATTNCATPTPESDFGEGLHLMSVVTSTVANVVVEDNFGGILLTDEMGPNHSNTITTDTASTNIGDCGITLAGHNPNAVATSGPTAGTTQPATGGVYGNLVIDNTADENGAAGLLAATPGPGTGVYDNTFQGNTAKENGLPGMTIHSHAPLQDANTNKVVDNTFVDNAVHGGPTGGPGDSTVPMTQTTGIEVYAAVTPVTGTVITGNTISTVFYGVWLSTGVLPASTVASNTISVVPGGTAVFSQPPPNAGYWMAASDGGAFSFGALTYHGSVPGTGLAIGNAVGVASTPDGGGYWIATATGAVHGYGDATSYGTLPALHVTVSDVVGIASAPTGAGYWLVAKDGGVFAFGSATFAGSMGGKPLNEPMVGMAAAPTGGYWTVAADGGIFAYGGAAFAGSMGGKPLNEPMVGMAPTPTGGYWTVAADGGIFAYGGATYNGSLPGVGVQVTNVVGITSNP